MTTTMKTSTMKVYEVIIDEAGKDVSKKIWLDTSKRALHSRLSEGQTIIKCTDVSDQYKISINKLKETLDKAGYGQVEKDLIITALVNAPTEQ